MAHTRSCRFSSGGFLAGILAESSNSYSVPRARDNQDASRSTFFSRRSHAVDGDLPRGEHNVESRVDATRGTDTSRSVGVAWY